MTVNILISVNGYQDGIPMLLTPSSILSGEVHLSLTEPKEVNYLKIHLGVVSRSSVTYSTGKTTYTDVTTRRLADDEIPLMQETPGQVMHLSPGNHVFPFSFPMSGRELPSSYRHRCGNFLRWRLDVAADFKGHVFDRKNNLELLVDFPRPIVGPTYMQRIELDNEKNICCLCCADGPIILHGSISRTGVAPGSFIEVYARCDNASRRQLQMACKLVRNVHMGIVRKQNSKSSLTETLGPAVSPRQRGIDWRTTFQIPSDVRPPTIDQPPNFTVKYYIQVEMRIPRALDLELHFPITVGTENIDQGIVPYATFGM